MVMKYSESQRRAAPDEQVHVEESILIGDKQSLACHVDADAVRSRTNQYT